MVTDEQEGDVILNPFVFLRRNECLFHRRLLFYFYQAALVLRVRLLNTVLYC